jgi:hypothetical protein
LCVWPSEQFLKDIQKKFREILPHLVDHGFSVLAECENKYKLSSLSGLLRVDCFVEHKSAKCKTGATRGEMLVAEENLRTQQRKPDEWHLTGQGVIIRFFLVEVRQAGKALQRDRPSLALNMGCCCTVHFAGHINN